MKRFIVDLKKYYGYEVRDAKSVLKTEVANSYLNWIWWILDPLFTMLVYYLIFGLIFRATEEYFVIFLYIGQIMWGFFSKVVLHSVKMIRKNKGIISRVYVPKFVFLLSDMMVSGFKMMVSSVILVVLIIVLKVEWSWYMLCFIPILMVMFMLTFSFGVILMHFGVFIDDLRNIVSVIMQLFFYLSGIMFNIEARLTDYPEIAKLMVYGNPMALLIKNMRNVLIYQTMPEWGPIGVWALVALVLSTIGVSTIYKNENNYVKVI